MKRNIIYTWINHVKNIDKICLAEGLRQLNKATDSNYKQNSIYGWRDGHRTPPPKVLNYLQNKLTSQVFLEAGIADNLPKVTFNTIIKKLSVPQRKKPIKC